MHRLRMGIGRRLSVVERLLVVYFHGCYLLQEHCVLSRNFGSISSLERRFLELGALAPVCIHEDGFVIALDDGRHDTEGGVQLRVGD